MRSVKTRIAESVHAIFNDRARGEQPVQRHREGLFGQGSVARQVHGDVTSMMVGGVAALLMQMLHPAVLAGVWDHSSFREDMLGRLRRTARFIAVTTYGSPEEAEQAIAKVREVHRHVRGVLPDGTPYTADDPDLLAWVHVTEALCFLEAWKRYADPLMPTVRQDQYFKEAGTIAIRLGAADVPANRGEALELTDRIRPQLRADHRTREVARFLLNQPVRSLPAAPIKHMLFQAAIDLLPSWARDMHGLRGSTLTKPVITGGTLGLARTLRWVFRA